MFPFKTRNTLHSNYILIFYSLSMNIWKITISSWGTIVPIDAMRTISNKSRGRTGAHLAEKFLGAGHSIQYVNTGNGALPFIHPLQKNPLSFSPWQEELYKKLQKYVKEENLRIINTWSFEEYKNAMVGVARESVPGDVAIIAAAVSDYGMKETKHGKISSEYDEMSLELTKLPKVIDIMRSVSPSLVMIGFKLLPVEESKDETLEKLVEASIKQMQGSSQTDLVIANSSTASPWSSSIGIRDTLKVQTNGDYEIIDRRRLWEIILSEIPQLIKKRIQSIS